MKTITAYFGDLIRKDVAWLIYEQAVYWDKRDNFNVLFLLFTFIVNFYCKMFYWTWENNGLKCLSQTPIKYFIKRLKIYFDSKKIRIDWSKAPHKILHYLG